MEGFDDNEGAREREKLAREGVVFHFDHNAYLERHPEIQKMHNGEMIPARGFFKVLVKAPGGKYLLVVIFILVAVIVMLGFFNKRNEDVVSGVPVVLTAFAFDDTVYVTVKLDAAKQPGAVVAEIGAADADGNLIEKKMLQGDVGGEELLLRTTFTDYEIAKVVAVVKLNGAEKNISVAVSR